MNPVARQRETPGCGERGPEAEAAWRRLPGDSVTAIYLARIAEYRRTPPASGWDGSIILTEK